MKKRRQLYRHIVRATAGVGAALVLVSSLYTAPVQEKTYESTALLANAVGMFVSVAPNPDNTKAAALLAKEQELLAREASLRSTAPQSDSGYDLLSLAALAVSSLVLLLVVLNFYFDHLHTLERKRGPFQHT